MDNMKRCLALCLSVLLTLQCSPATVLQAAAAEVQETVQTEETVQPETTVSVEETAVVQETAQTEPAPETEAAAEQITQEAVGSVLTEEIEVMDAITVEIDGFPEPEELYERYVDGLFYGRNDVSFFGELARSELSSQAQGLYDHLKEQIQKIASGEQSSSEFKITYDQLVAWGDTVGYMENSSDVFPAFQEEFQLVNVVNALLHDCPYDLYWYDKVSGITPRLSRAVNAAGQYRVNYVVLPFSVVEDLQTETYSATSPTVDTTKTSAAKNAVANAAEIVATYEEKNDFEKLKGYKGKILELVSYDHSANPNNFSTDSDPWQLVYVFDGDVSTNVVCEGYSKAFQYLCDMSQFRETVKCYSVTGDLITSSGSEGHMWNIVTVEGANYLADLTNSDTGTVGQSGSLFLAGGSGSITEGYTIGTTGFAYDSGTMNLWGTDDDSILKLAGEYYDPCANGHTEVAIPAEDAGCTETGLTEGAVCEQCGTVTKAQETVPAAGHDYDAGICTLCGEALPDPEWEVGTIAAASGQDTDNTTRLRTVGYLKLSDYAAVTLNPGYTITYLAYDQDFNYLGNGSETQTGNWLGSGVGITGAEIAALYADAAYFRLALRTVDSAALTLDAVSDSGIYVYGVGEDVPVREAQWSQEAVMNASVSQDGAIYNGNAFLFNGSGTCNVYRLSDESSLGSFTLDKLSLLTPHANSVCFGNSFYDDSDEYPLLYVNIYNNYSSAADRMEGTCCVYRITETDGVFSTELVQVIEIGFTEDLTLWKSKENNGDVRPYGNFTVDTDNDKLYAFVMRDADKTTRFFRFALPALTEGTYSETYGCNVVTLESTDIEAQFDLTYFNYLQGCCISDGKLLSLEGFGAGTSAESALRIVDLESEILEKTYYFSELGLTQEPEMISVENGTIYYAAADGVLRKLTLNDIHFHTYTTTVTAPTCIEQGYTTHTCSCGDAYTDSYVDTLDHDWQAETCTEAKICKTCGAVEGEALGHTEAVDEAVEATCTETGLTEGRHCTECGEVIVEQEEVPATGHNYTDWYVSKLATMEEDGEVRRDCLSCDHSETSNIESPDSLDDVAWEGLTYRDIFITSNKVYVDGFNAKSFSPFVQNTGTNTITKEFFHTGPYSLAAFGSSSQQLASPATLGEAGDYFLASKAYCTRYVTGTLGVCLGYNSVGLQNVTDGFVTTSGIVSAEASNKAFLGSFHSADLDGYVDDPVAVKLTLFENVPDLAQLTVLYENYVALEKAREREEVLYSDDEALDAFVKYMNGKAASIGMMNSQFKDPVGLDNLATASDLLRLMVHAESYEELSAVWGAETHTVSVGGENARQQMVISTVIKSELENYYHILGGKTGTLSAYDARNLAVILEIPNSDDRLAVVALYADGQDGSETSRFVAVRQAADAAMKKYADPSADNTSAQVCCQSAIACLIPAEGADIDSLQILYSQNPDAQLVPASITKVLTAICALDIQKDLTAEFIYNTVDTNIGNFYAGDFTPGDSLTYSDALYAMLLPSSNVTARAVARTAGKLILEQDIHIHAYDSIITTPTCTEQGYTTHTCANCGDSYVDSYVDALGHSFVNNVCATCGKEWKTISILGASISTYAGTSNGAAADTTNSTIRSNVAYYPNSTISEVTLNDTWWMQACEDLGLRLLVNNSWSGSSLLHERSGTVGAYVDRCVQLHDDTGDNAGEEPDIIAIQMGTNDFQYYKDTLGTADIDYAALITDNGDGSFSYAEPATSLEAAAIVLHKISVRYPNAEIYYLNISQRVDGTDALIQTFNADLKTVVEHFDASIVDIYGSAITMEDFDIYIGDGRVHPNNFGMDAYTEAFKAAFLVNSAYSQEFHMVSFDLTDVSTDYGTDKAVLDGDAFSVTLTPAISGILEVTVTMDGSDITDSVCADGIVTIEAVTGDVVITAKSVHAPKDYRWEFDGTDLACVSGENTLTKNAGTTADGVFSTTRYALETAVVLRHDLPWALEWKSEGTWKNTSGSGGRLFTSSDVNADYNARYIFKSNTNGIVAMGEKATTGSHNYGVALADHGIDWTALHTYRMENRIADDGTNMVYIYVDGTEIGPMTSYYIGTTSQNTTSDWLSGKDFVFPYMGTDTHGFNNCAIEYIQVWEGGHNHSYTATKTEPACTEPGYTTYTCACGESYVDSYVEATGHSYGDWTVTTDPTCTASGEERRDCSNCDHYETRDVTAKGHTEVAVTGKAATCTEAGLTDGKKCSTCGIVTVVQQTIAAKGHTEVTMTGRGATCTESGLTDGKKCSVCGTVTVVQQTIAAKGHTELIDEAVYATCTENGLTEGKHCSVCGEIMTEQEVVPAKGHTEVIDEAVEATCTETGLTEGMYCALCGEILVEQKEIPDKGHTEVIDEASEATCTEAGLTEGKHCSVCGMVLEKQQTVPALGHSYESVVTEPSCTEQGYTTHTCTVCGDSYVDSQVDALGHTEAVDEAVEATCTETGLTEGKHCTVCGMVLEEQQTVPALGHSYESVVTEPSCTEQGYTTHTCTVCGDSYVDSQVDALGHTETVDEAVEATCTETGLTEGKHCAVCGTVLVEQQTVPALGHSYASVVTEPTCVDAGFTTYTCDICGDSYVDAQTEPTGKHTYLDDKDADCEVCGQVRDVKVETTPMYRLYNPNSGEHFYTGSIEERDMLVAAGWNYEGIAWNAPIYEGDPVHRVYNPNSGDHHYTMSQDEVDMLVGLGWQYEGVAWNSGGDVAQQRLYNPNADCGSHHYTSSQEELDFLVSIGWIHEGVGWFGMLN